MINLRKSLFFVIFFLVVPFAFAQENEKPNIIILFADDMGYADLSSFGSEETNTPVLDRLASQGMKFTNFYAGSAVCSPSRASLLTGRFAVRAGVYSWVSEREQHKMHLHKDEVTIAEVLKKQGYETAHIGKWHLGFDLIEGSGPRPTPGDQGFDYWFATVNNAKPSHHNPDNFVRNGEPVGEIKGYSSHIVVDEAFDWLDNNRDNSKPFFLNMWFHEPHQPVAAPPALNQRHEDTGLPAYYGCIENMDMAIGRLLEKLDIPEDQEGELLDICYNAIKSNHEPVAIQVYAMAIISKFARAYPELTYELTLIIEDKWDYASPAFKSRAGKILKSIRKV